MKEATARIKINKLLEAAGWRFFPEGGKYVLPVVLTDAREDGGLFGLRF